MLRSARILPLAELFVGLAVAPAPTHADEEAPPEIRVSRRGRVSVSPDLAFLEVGVVTEAKTAAKASASNAARTDAVVRALKKVLPSTSEVATARYTLKPKYERTSQRNEIVGFTASNSVRVKTRDLKGIGNAIDAATSAGANTVGGLYFTLEDDLEARTRALQLATSQARHKADTIAQALGVRIVRVLSAEESAGDATPVYRAQGRLMAAEAAVAPPVEAGDVEVRANVSLQPT